MKEFQPIYVPDLPVHLMMEKERIIELDRELLEKWNDTHVQVGLWKDKEIPISELTDEMMQSTFLKLVWRKKRKAES